MSRSFFIAGTDTGVGKTRITVGLLRALRQRGIVACGMKPVATGVNAVLNPAWFGELTTGSANLDDDAAAIAAASAKVFLAEDLSSYRFLPPISPHIAADRAGIEIDPDRIAAAYARIASRCQWVIVEGTGGWYAPVSRRATMADIARRLGLPVILVVGIRLGCLNHALLTHEAIERSGLGFAGWIGSVLDPALDGLHANIATLADRLRSPPLALLPHGGERGDDARHLDTALERLLGG